MCAKIYRGAGVRYNPAIGLRSKPDCTEKPLLQRRFCTLCLSFTVGQGFISCRILRRLLYGVGRFLQQYIFCKISIFLIAARDETSPYNAEMNFRSKTDCAKNACCSAGFALFVCLLP